MIRVLFWNARLSSCQQFLPSLANRLTTLLSTLFGNFTSQLQFLTYQRVSRCHRLLHKHTSIQLNLCASSSRVTSSAGVNPCLQMWQRSASYDDLFRSPLPQTSPSIAYKWLNRVGRPSRFSGLRLTPFRFGFLLLAVGSLILVLDWLPTKSHLEASRSTSISIAHQL